MANHLVSLEKWISDINTFKAWLRSEIENSVTIDVFMVAPSKWQIDRKDPKGGYSPDNCRLVSVQENMRNKNKPKRLIVSIEGDQFFI